MHRAKRLAVLCVIIVLTAICASIAACSGHVHKFENWDFDDTYHWKVCSDPGCDETDNSTISEHELDQNGKCKCGFEKISSLTTPSTPSVPSGPSASYTPSDHDEHDFTGEWIAVDATYHARKCAHESCNEDVFDPISSNWAKHTKKLTAYEADGQDAGHYEACTICGYIDEETKNAHTFVMADGGEYHYETCECGTIKDGSESFHSFLFSDEENEIYFSDIIGHWKECECGARDEIDEHIFTAWNIVESTCSTHGQKSAVCDAEHCAYERIVELPLNPDVHEYGEDDNIEDDERHVYHPTCGCDNASDIYEDHSYDESEQCVTCGYEKPNLCADGHSFYVGGVWLDECANGCGEVRPPEAASVRNLNWTKSISSVAAITGATDVITANIDLLVFPSKLLNSGGNLINVTMLGYSNGSFADSDYEIGSVVIPYTITDIFASFISAPSGIELPKVFYEGEFCEGADRLGNVIVTLKNIMPGNLPITNILVDNGVMRSENIYYYSDKQPSATDHNYWHYISVGDSVVPVSW